MSIEVLVAGVGNIFLGDDAFGCEVARRLATEPLPAGVQVADYGIGGLHLAYDIADGIGALVLVDALPHDGAPGEIVVIEASLDDLPTSSFDGHGMDPATVLRSVRNLGVEPPRTLVVGCKPASLEEGIGLSPAVAAAVEPAARTVLGLLQLDLTVEER